MRGWATLAALAYVRALLAIAISVFGGADASAASWRGGGVVPLCAGSEHASKGNTISIFGAGAFAPSRGDWTNSIDVVALNGMTPCSMEASRRPNMLSMTKKHSRVSVLSSSFASLSSPSGSPASSAPSYSSYKSCSSICPSAWTNSLHAGLNT
jgi:hypothetical protein